MLLLESVKLKFLAVPAWNTSANYRSCWGPLNGVEFLLWDLETEWNLVFRDTKIEWSFVVRDPQAVWIYKSEKKSKYSFETFKIFFFVFTFSNESQSQLDLWTLWSLECYRFWNIFSFLLLNAILQQTKNTLNEVVYIDIWFVFVTFAFSILIEFSLKSTTFI